MNRLKYKYIEQDSYNLLGVETTEEEEMEQLLAEWEEWRATQPPVIPKEKQQNKQSGVSN